MGLNVLAGTVAAPGVNGGTATISLGASFDPKALILFAVPSTVAETLSANATQVIGVATKDGGAVQRATNSITDTDNSGTAVLGQAVKNDSCLSFPGAAPGQLADISAGDWTDSQIVLTFTNSNAATLIGFLALGGSDIESAKVGTFALSTAVATQDVTVGFSGGGQPDLLFFLPSHLTALGFSTSTDFNFGLGLAKSDTDRFCSIYKGDNGHTTNEKASIQKARAFCTFADNALTLDCEADLSARASWPATGYQLSYPDQAARASQVVYLALKGTFTSTLVNADTLTAGSTQDHAHGSTPKAFLSATSLVAATDSVDTSSAQLGGVSLGVSDLTNEAAAATGSDDGQGTSWTWRALSTTKALYTLDQPASSTAAPVERAQADATASGNNLRLTYTTLDSVAREYIGLVLGAAVGGATTVPLGAATATASPTLALTAQTQIPLAASSAVASPTLALKAQTQVPLGAASAQASPTLALSAATQILLAASSAAASATASLTARTHVPFGAASALSSASLAVSAQTVVPLGAAQASATPTLALQAQTVVPLGAASAQATATAAVSAQTRVPLAASTATASASLAFTAQTVITLDPASATGNTSLSVTAPTGLELAGSDASSSASVALTASTRLGLGAASSSSAAALTLTAATEVPLDPVAAAATTSLTLETPEGAAAEVPLSTSAGTATTSLALTAAAQVPLVPASAAATASLTLSAPTQVGLAAAQAAGSASVTLTAPAGIVFSASATAAATLVLSALTGLQLAPVSATASGSLVVGSEPHAPSGAGAIAASTAGRVASPHTGFSDGGDEGHIARPTTGSIT